MSNKHNQSSTTDKLAQKIAEHKTNIATLDLAIKQTHEVLDLLYHDLQTDALLTDEYQVFNQGLSDLETQKHQHEYALARCQTELKITALHDKMIAIMSKLDDYDAVSQFFKDPGVDLTQDILDLQIELRHCQHDLKIAEVQFENLELQEKIYHLQDQYAQEEDLYDKEEIGDEIAATQSEISTNNRRIDALEKNKTIVADKIQREISPQPAPSDLTPDPSPRGKG